MAKIKYEFDSYEDRDEFDIFCRAPEMHAVVCEIHSMVRNRLKHEENLFDNERSFLLRLQEELGYISELL